MDATKARRDRKAAEKEADRREGVVADFVEEMGLFYQAKGFPRIGGRIIALLLVATEPLCAEAIAERLGVSRASVSTNVRLLLARGAAEEVSLPGDRLTYYRFSWSAWERGMREQLEGLGRALQITSKALGRLGEGDPSRGRILEYEGWVGFFTDQYRRMLESWPAAGPSDRGGRA